MDGAARGNLGLSPGRRGHEVSLRLTVAACSTKSSSRNSQRHMGTPTGSVNTALSEGDHVEDRYATVAYRLDGNQPRRT